MMRGGFMKRFLAAVAAVMLLAALCGCRDMGDSARVRQDDVLHIAVVEGDELFSLAEFIAQDIGVEVEYHTAADRQGALELLKAGRADVAVAYFDRSYGSDFAMTMPFGGGYIYAVTLEGEPCGSLGALSGKRICADPQLDAVLLNSISAVSACDIGAAADIEAAAQQLSDGDIDAYLCAEESAFQMISQNSGLRCSAIPELDRMEYRVALISGSDLYAEVNAAIAKMTVEQ